MLDGSAAISRMAPGTKNVASACLYTVWVALGCPHTLGRLAGHTFATATEAYQYTTKRHTDRNPPAGVPVWFGSTAGPRYAGDKHWADGDVALSVGNGFLYGTDYPTFGHTGKCTIAQREAQTRRVYLGWTEDFLGNDVAFAGSNSTTLEDDMPTTEEVVNGLLNHAAYDGGPTVSVVLKGVFEAIFTGGTSMPGGKSIATLLGEAASNGGANVGADVKQILSVVAAINAVVQQPVLRDGKPVKQIQDNADTNTMVRELLARTGDVVPSGVSLTQEQVTQAVTAALATLTLKATS